MISLYSAFPGSKSNNLSISLIPLSNLPIFLYKHYNWFHTYPVPSGEITLEYAIDYINSDELVEVTPHHIRLRKRILNTQDRKKFDARQN